MGSRKRIGRRRDRDAAVPGRRGRKQIEVKVREEAERGERLKYVKGRLKDLIPELVAKILIENAAAPSSKNTGIFSKELKVMMSLIGAIPGMEGETRRFLNIAKARRKEGRQVRWW